MDSKAFGIGCLLAGTAVMLSAFGAHSLREILSEERLEWFRTGATYQLYHGIAMLLASLAAQRCPRPARTSAILFGIGIVLFSGSLYLLAATNLRMLGAITPFGGLAFISGWLVLAIGAFRQRDGERA